jgi:hypothetical protein
MIVKENVNGYGLSYNLTSILFLTRVISECVKNPLQWLRKQGLSISQLNIVFDAIILSRARRYVLVFVRRKGAHLTTGAFSKHALMHGLHQTAYSFQEFR